MKKNRKVIIGIVSAVLGLCLICFIIAIISSPSKKDQTGLATKQTEISLNVNDKQKPTEPLTKDGITQEGKSTPDSTSTLTSTVTPSETPLPHETQTAIAINTQKTQSVGYITETAEAKNAVKTQSAVAVTTTMEALNQQRTTTKEARSAEATKIAEYKDINWRELTTYPGHHTGEKIKISGQIFNINGDQELQMYVGNYEALYVVMAEPFSGIYEDGWIVVYGTVDGTNCGANALGGQVCQALVKDAFYTIP
jgi:hypothetical protein